MKIETNTGKTMKDLQGSIVNYRKAGIEVEVIDGSIESGEITVKISQRKLINGYILNQHQLINRVSELFKGVPIEKPFLSIKVIPVVYSLDVDTITIPWIESKMEEFGLSRKDLIKQLAIDKVSLSKIFSGITGLSKPMRALFYYYFLTYEINRDIREAM